LSYGETEPKEYLTIEFDAAGYTVHHHAVRVLPMFHVAGRLTRAGFAFDDLTQVRPSWKDCDVRVRYVYQQSEKDALDHARVAACFADAARLKLEPLAVPDRALRAPAVAIATTLAEKVAAWAEVSGVVPTADLLHKLARLETTEPAVLLDAVEAELAALTSEDEEPEIPDVLLAEVFR
jgi:hypothetical protein